MPKKITDEIKNSEAFKHAIANSCNNREAARYHAFFADNGDFAGCDDKVKQVLLAVCHEPNVNTETFNVSIEKDGFNKPTRSKLVMEYARHNRMFLNVAKLRHTNKSLCDNILHSVSIDEMQRSISPRAYVLDLLSQRVNP
jgi:hypothetical protein